MLTHAIEYGCASAADGFCADTAQVKVLIDHQSPEIAQVGAAGRRVRTLVLFGGES